MQQKEKQTDSGKEQLLLQKPRARRPPIQDDDDDDCGQSCFSSPLFHRLSAAAEVLVVVSKLELLLGVEETPLLEENSSRQKELYIARSEPLSQHFRFINFFFLQQKK